MVDLLELHKEFILRHLKTGDTAVDFTMGNGHDTLFLAQSVGENGHVYAFDIQEGAVENTRKLLTEQGVIDRVTLIHDSHHNAANYINREIKAGMFNLGYLPGGDKSVTTQRVTTLPAVKTALDLLSSDGILLIAIYPGHAEGELEGRELENYLPSLDRRTICISEFKIINSPTSPFFIMAEKK